MKLDLWKNKVKAHPTQNDPHQLGYLLKDRTMGQPIRFGRLSMIPLFGAAIPAGNYAAPQTSLTLAKVTDYGKMVLVNKSKLPAILPLHIGYFQQGAQNHAMCTSYILKGEEQKEFKDACCIQEAQGGYIKEQDDRFIVLPHPLRNAALHLIGKEEYGKLWKHISKFNTQLNLKERGHLDELKQAYQPELLQTSYHLEPQVGQTGAIFLCENEVLGIELAPDAAFYAELHMPLVIYGYAPLRLMLDIADTPKTKGQQLDIHNLKDLNDLHARYQTVKNDRMNTAKNTRAELEKMSLDIQPIQEEGNHRLVGVKAGDFAGQAVYLKSEPAYVSMFNTQAWTIEV